MKFQRALLIPAASALATAAPPSPPPSYPAPNQLVGTWTLTSSSLTINGTTTYPYGDKPQGLLFHTPAPELTWIEELNARPGVADAYMAQANGGTYEVDGEGAFKSRVTLASTVPGNVGVGDNTTVFRLTRVGDTLVQELTPSASVVVSAVWTKFKPGSSEI